MHNIYLIKRVAGNGQVQYLHRNNGFVYGPCSAKPTTWKTLAGAEKMRQELLTYGWKDAELTIEAR